MPSELSKLEGAKNAAWCAFVAERDVVKARKLHTKYVRAYNRWANASRRPTYSKR